MRWNLDLLYKGFDDPSFMMDVDAAEQLAGQLLECVKRMDVNTKEMECALKKLQELHNLMIKTSAFSRLTMAADALSECAQAAWTRLMPIINTEKMISSALSARLKDESIQEVVGDSELLREHASLLKMLQRDAEHLIDPVLEPLALEMQLTGGEAWSQLRDQLDAGLMIDIEKDGAVEKYPLSAVRGMAYSADADVRRKAYEAELGAYPRMEVPMAACLNGIKGEAIALSKLRHYDSVLDMALDVSLIDRETLDALLEAMNESLPIFRRYMRLKAKMLGYEGGLKFYDLFAPVGEMNSQYTVEQAHEMLVRELGAFSPRMGKMIDRAFREGWIDMYPREGKTGGAFCSGVHPLGMSYVLSNFEGSYSSVSTLAHELGHAYQNECMRDESVLLSDYPMPLAETASIFNEMLLGQCMLQGADKGTRIAMIEQQLGDATQVIVDILSRFLFESEVLKRRADHTLSPRELCEIMLDAQKKTYGDGLDPNCMHPYMWACKCHYYMTDVHFYNFPYAFGQLFALGVYALYEQKGADFLPMYEKLLRDSGKGLVREVAASVGIDVADANFWRSSLSVFESALDELESLI